MTNHHQNPTIFRYDKHDSGCVRNKLVISWKLWQALHHPPRHHPLFKYTLTHAKKEEPAIAPGFFMWVFMCSTLTLISTFIVSWLPYIFMTLVVLLNTIYALRWTWRISSTIVAEKENSRYDLLAALPIGMLGTSWALSTGCLHRRSSFRWLPYLLLMLAITTTITMVIIGLLTLSLLRVSSNVQSYLANINIVEIAVLIVPFMFAFYLDNLYSLLTATLIGMVVTIDVNNSSDARLSAVIGFAALQLTVYAIIFTVLMVALPRLFAFFGWTGLLTLMIEAAVGLIVFIVIREWFVRRLWYYLTCSFSAEANDIELVLQPVS
jgi:hypothetical protein